MSLANGMNRKFATKVLVENVYGCKIISSEIGLNQQCQNHFPGFSFEPKICIEIFWTKLFYGCKIISSGIGLNQIFSSKVFGRKFLLMQILLLGNRIEPNIFITFFIGRKFLLLQNNFLGEGFEPRIFIKTF